MGYINMVFVHNEELVESPVMAIQETTPVHSHIRMERKKKIESSPPVRPYQPPLLFPQRVVWFKLSKLAPRFARFNISFLEALKEAPSYLKFLRELLSKKGKLDEVTTIPIG